MTSDSTARGLALATAAVLLVAAAVGTATAAGASHASARLADADGDTVGRAELTQDSSGRLHLNVHVRDLAPGRHGIHLHSVGSCVGPTFASAGGHVNPLGAEHGLENPNGAHGGDLPNLVVNVAGVGHLDAISDRATIGPGPLSLLDADGSALIIHANEDDQVTNPTGNSGARIACGVLEAG